MERLVCALQVNGVRNIQRAKELKEQIMKKEEEAKKKMKEKES